MLCAHRVRCNEIIEYITCVIIGYITCVIIEYFIDYRVHYDIIEYIMILCNEIMLCAHRVRCNEIIEYFMRL